MGVPNIDLLRRSSNRDLAFFGVQQVGSHVRQDIIRSLENGIVNAAAAGEREERQRTASDKRIGPYDDAVVLRRSRTDYPAPTFHVRRSSSSCKHRPTWTGAFWK